MFFCTNEILVNVANKTSLIRFSGNLMERDGIKVTYCKGDADTTIVKEALETDGETVVLFADAYDVFFLLIHRAMEYVKNKIIPQPYENVSENWRTNNS